MPANSNTAEIIAFPSTPTILPRAISLEALYDSTGAHLGGVYSPLMVGGQLTPEHAGCLSTRPAELLIYYPDACPSPREQLALVWMLPSLPLGADPVAFSPAVLPYLIHALEAGYSVQLHATTAAQIQAVQVAVRQWLGGGHA